MNMYFTVFLFVLLGIMCSLEPMLHCVHDVNWPTATCPAADNYQQGYSVCSMCAMVMHWLVLIDMAVLYTEIAAFLLVVFNVLGEVQQFLCALLFLLFLFGSSIAILCTHCTEDGGEFNDMGNAIISLFAITVRLYQGDFRDMAADWNLLAFVLVFVILSAVLLLNLLVAQLNLSYEYIYRDMLGFARLNRASLIVGAMSSCSTSRWNRFSASLELEKRLEFDKGDLGLPGAIQLFELASLHLVNTEQIRRFGGTTSVEQPWPEDDEDHDQEEDIDERFDRLEALAQKALKCALRLTEGHAKPDGGSTAFRRLSSGMGEISLSDGSSGTESDVSDQN